MAAGTVIIAHKSGGPLMDIVTDYEGQPTGFLADSVDTYAKAMHNIISMSEPEREKIQANARRSVKRFSAEEFELGFIDAVAPIIDLL